MVLRKRSLAEALEADEPLVHGNGDTEPEAGQTSWRDCLVRALVEMPPEVAERVIQSFPRDVLFEALKSRDDPYVRLALKLLGLGR